ncbi:unnamed protein product, partial [marine sediment metagenome]
MTLLVAQGFDDPFATMIKALGYNFYPMLALLLVLIIIFSKKDFGPMARSERRAREEGKLLSDNAKPMISDAITSVTCKHGVKPKACNMVIPILTMVLMMPVLLAYTGWSSAMEKMPEAGVVQKVLFAIGQGSGSTAVL